MTTFVLQKTSHPLYHTKPKSLWLHIHFRHDIKPPVSEVTATLSLSSQPLHWNHTHFLFHHTHYICDIICTIYNIISTAMSSNYSTYDSTNLTYETTSSMQFKIYTTPVTSQSLICVITPTVLRTSHPLFVWHHTRHRYNIFFTIEDITSSLHAIKPPFYDITPTIFHHINAISVTTSTVFMI